MTVDSSFKEAPSVVAAVNRILGGDCVTEMKTLPDRSVDLVFADPPFNIGYDYDEYDDNRDDEAYVAWSKEWMAEVWRVLKNDGTFWLAIGDEFAAELKVAATRTLGFTCRSWVIWYYTFGVHCKYKFTRSHTHLFHFVKDNSQFTFNADNIRVPSARELVYGDKRAHPAGRMPDDTWMMAPVLPADVPTRDGFVLRPQDIPERFPPHSDMWYFSRVAGTFKERAGFHGCQMPEQLLGRIINCSSNEGDLVLDPFAGSGTTLAVAKKLNRRFLGFELSENYVEMIRRRLDAVNAGDALDGPADAVKSAPRTIDGRRLERSKAPVSVPAEVSKSPVPARANASLGQIAVANGELAATVVEAFLASHQGYSLDRVLADPELNDSFLDNCRLLGIPGEPKDWNHLLVTVRKRGRLAPIETTRRTTVRREQMEDYLFASEIAWRRLSEQFHVSLDEILCNPATASKFDALARRIAPGFTPFEYRWAALSLRKYAAKGDGVLDWVTAVLAPRIVTLAQVGRLPAGRGHYLVSAAGQPFYVGFAESLRECPLLQPDRLGAALQCLKRRVNNDAELTVKTLTFDIRTLRRRHARARESEWIAARRAKLIAKHEPIANVQHAA